MRYTAQVRKFIKRECRARVTENLGRCIGVQLLYMAPFALLSVLLYALLFGRALALAAAGCTDAYCISRALTGGADAVWGVLFLMLVVSGPLNYGMMRFYIGLRRGREPDVCTLLRPFASLGDIWLGIRMVFCLLLRALLWLAIPVFAFVGAAGAMTVALLWNPNSAAGYVGLLTLYAVFFIAVLLICVKLTTYSAGWVIVQQDARYGAWAASRDGSRVFKGHYGSVLAFMLSFAPWGILLYAAVGVCSWLGTYGLHAIGGSMGAAVAAAAWIAALCIGLTLGAFTMAYGKTSFVGLYEYFAQQEREERPDGEPEQ